MFDQALFGQRLLALRKANKETQPDLAAVLGVSVPQISEMERGNKGTTMEKLYLICTHYHISADYLLGLDGQMEETGEKEGGTGQQGGTL